MTYYIEVGRHSELGQSDFSPPCPYFLDQIWIFDKNTIAGQEVMHPPEDLEEAKMGKVSVLRQVLKERRTDPSKKEENN